MVVWSGSWVPQKQESEATSENRVDVMVEGVGARVSVDYSESKGRE